MVKRAVKRRAKKVSTIVLVSLGTLLAIFSLLFVYNNFIPKITPKSSKAPDKIIKPIGAMITTSQLSKKLNDATINYDSVEATEGALLVRINEGPKVYFSTTEDLNWQMSSLVLILQRLTINNKKPLIVDLRSSKPIVKF